MQVYYNENSTLVFSCEQKQPPEVFYRKKVFLKTCKIHRVTPVPESFFNKVALNRLWHMCLPVSFAKFLRTPFYIEQLRWLLLKLVIFNWLLTYGAYLLHAITPAKQLNDVWNLFKVNNKDTKMTSLSLLSLSIFSKLFWCFHSCLWLSKYQLEHNSTQG